MSQTDKNITQTDIDGTDFVGDKLLELILTVNLSILATIVALFGILSNIVNILVFIKQGLNDTVNISLIALAISDFCSLVTLEWMNLLNNQLFINNVPLILVEVQHLTAAWPHACFARITSWMTVYITLERCLCVVIPLKIKRVITPKVTICVIVSIFLVIFLSLIPDYSTCYLDWRFVPEQNRSMLGLVFLPGRDKLAALSFNISVGTQLLSFGAVIVFTSILVIKIKNKSKWRISVSNSNSQNEIQARDKKTVKMITLVAIIYCVCFLPMLGTFIVTSVEPKFIVFGAYNNSFFVAWSFSFLFDSINSSANIIVYYNMSTKYRTIFGSFVEKITSGKKE